MDVGSHIRKLRKSKKISSTKLAELAGLGQSTISDIELNKKQPTIGTLESICFALGITLAEFFQEEFKKEYVSIDEVVKELEYLTPSQLEAIKNLIKSFS